MKELNKHHSSFPKELTHHQLHAQTASASDSLGQGALGVFWSGHDGSWDGRSFSGLRMLWYSATHYVRVGTPT